MAVPGATSNYLNNTTGGTFISTTEGGTILGNTTTSTDRISKALALKDNAADFGSGPKPRELADGLSGNFKILSAGTFAYEAAGKYVIAASSSTLSGVSKTNILITGQGGQMDAIHQFIHDFGADTTSLMRKNRFAHSGFLNTGVKAKRRTPWLNSTGGAVAAPTTLTTHKPWNPESSAAVERSDSAANPTRAIPGELVMKVDFVTLAQDNANAGDFFNYKAITGM